MPRPVKRIGVGDGPAVNGADRQFLGRGDLHAVSDGAATKPAFGLTEPAAEPARGRPVERAAERTQRDGDGVRAPRVRAGASAGPDTCSWILSYATCSSPTYCAVRSRRESISDILAVRAATARSASSARLARHRFAGLDLASPLRECGSLGSKGITRSVVLGDSLLVDARQRRDGPRGASELAHISRAEEQARVSTASALVDVHELLLHVRHLGQSLQLEAGESIGRLLQRPLGFRRLCGRLLGLLVLQVALDLELAEIADERARFARQTLRLPLEARGFDR